MLAYLSFDQIKDFRVFTPVFNPVTERYEWSSLKISEVSAPMAPGCLDLKRLFNIQEIKYRLKWKRESLPSHTFTTGVHEASVSGDGFEVVNPNFLQALGAHAGGAASLPNGDLASAPEKIIKASLIVGTSVFFDSMFLFSDNSDFMPVWPLRSLSDTDIRFGGSFAPAYGNVAMTEQPAFSGVRRGANSGAGAFRASMIKADFLGPTPNTDLTAETSLPADYNSSNSFYDVDFAGHLVVYYREFWQIIYGL